MIEEQQKAAEKQEEELIEELEQEISELKMRNTELGEALTHWRSPPPPTGQSTSLWSVPYINTPHAEGFFLSPAVDLLIPVQPYKHQELAWDQYEDLWNLETLRRALTQLQHTLDEKLTKTGTPYTYSTYIYYF